MTGTDAEHVAVIGAAIRVPGARSVDQFWTNLRSGIESIARFGADELRAHGAAPAELAAPEFVAAGGVIDGVDRFDAGLFGLSEREAELTDPAQRAFLECAWEALERAGHHGSHGELPIGVYAVATSSDFLLDNLHRVTDPDERNAVFGHDLAALVSARLGLTGPSLTIQGACSAALVAVHVACQAVLAGECAIALAGASCASLRHRRGYRSGGELSRDGHCRAFSARATGAVPADGIGAVVLRRLDHALRDRDTIHGVIRGSALNHTGGARIGIATQVALVREALSVARIDPRSIGHVEVHGNGVADEEAVEVRVLTEAFRHATGDRGFCTIGSVKPNVGHAGPATGMAMLIKLLAMLDAGERPPALHADPPNPAIRFDDTPFRVNPEIAPWPGEPSAPRRGGVGVFGNGLCNAYLVVEQAPPRPTGDRGRDHQLLLLSARSHEALLAIRSALRDHLLAHPEHDPADVAFSYHGRRAFEHRAALCFADRAELLAGLAAPLAPGTSAVVDRRPPRVALWCPDADERLAAAARTLRHSEPGFRDAYDECARSAGGALTGAAAAFATQLGIARIWRDWGIQPSTTLGAGLGAQVAARLTGALSLVEALSRACEHPGRRPAPAAVGTDSAAQVVLELGDREAPARDERRIASLEAAAARGAERALVEAAARLWLAGVAIDPVGFYRHQRRCRLALPGYRFGGARHGWLVGGRGP